MTITEPPFTKRFCKGLLLTVNFMKIWRTVLSQTNRQQMDMVSTYGTCTF